MDQRAEKLVSALLGEADLRDEEILSDDTPKDVRFYLYDLTSGAEPTEVLDWLSEQAREGYHYFYHREYDEDRIVVVASRTALSAEEVAQLEADENEFGR